MNGYFKLYIKDNGTYLKLFPPTLNGNKIEFEDISNYLNWCYIKDYDLSELMNALLSIEDKPIEVKLCSSMVLPVNEYVNINISEDRMYATGTFYPQSNKGNTLTKLDIIDKLKNEGVKYGILEENIDNYINNRVYAQEIILAKGIEPVQGRDAFIDYKFKIGSSKPKLNEDGSVDFHNLDIISHVNKGDILAVLTPADKGKEGIDVTGNIIKPKKVKTVTLKHGNNIHLSEDKTIMYTDVSGHAIYAERKVFVSDVYDVPADVNTSTGNIRYDGNIHVKGNIRTGYVVEAKGDIIVDGVVEGAILKAGGQIIIKRGIQGINKGILEAKGNIISKFIENATVKSGGTITTEAVMHSNISAKDEIYVNGSKGFISGGEARAGKKISVKTAGSTMGTQTTLEVGVDPAIVEEFHVLSEKVSRLIEDKEKLDKIVSLLKNKQAEGVDLTQEKIKMLQDATKNSIILNSEIKKADKHLDELQDIIEENVQGKIIINNIVYHGVKIIISNETYYVKDGFKYCQFVKEGADIRLKPLK